MATTPKLKSYEQILGEALATYQSKIGVTDLNRGSAVVTFFEANAQMTYRATGDVVQILKDYSIDRAGGEYLKRLALEERIRLLPARAATSFVTIEDSSFDKIATKIYAGTRSPNVGSTTINVGNVDGFPPSGQIYIGRNTPNVEGPIAYTAITPVGSYFEISLLLPTNRFHNISESVILAQGGVRTIPTGTVVQTSSMGGSSPIKFATTAQAIILDGEDSISSVPIVAQKPGAEANVARNAIKEFVAEPFPGALVLNPNPVINGREDEDDESLRNRIKMTRASKGLGTDLAIKNATLGLTANDETATVVSNELVRDGGKSTLYLDDGTGYERKTNGVGVEYIIDSALGGETSVKLMTGGNKTGIAKAFVLSGNREPFAINDLDKLSVLVGDKLSEHIFRKEDFRATGNAMAYEVVASINSNYDLLFNATTSEGGTKVVLIAKEEENEYLQVTKPSSGEDAGDALNFPSEQIETLKLYKNDILLSANGRDAFLVSTKQEVWAHVNSGVANLIISVDGTPFQTYTFFDQDFADNTEYQTLNESNSLESWCQVINAKIPGVIATVDGQSIRISSNKGRSSSSSVEIREDSTLVSMGGFFEQTKLKSRGLTKDYIFSRNTAELKLNTPLKPKDKLTAGSKDTFAKLKSDEILGALLNIANDGNFWILIDDANAEMIGTTLAGNQQIQVYPEGDGIALEVSSGIPFSRVEPDDYMIIWSKDFSVNNRVEGRVLSATSTKVVISLTTAEASSVVTETVYYQTGIVTVRTKNTPQKIKVTAGVYNIDDFCELINPSIVGAYLGTENDSRLVLRSKTVNDDYAAVMVISQDSNAKALNFKEGASSLGKENQTATYESPNDVDYIPAFVHSLVGEGSANPPDSYINNVLAVDIDFDAEKIDRNDLISFIDSFNGEMPQPIREIVQIENYTAHTLIVENNVFVKRLKDTDRMFVSLGYQFGYNDSLVIVLDSDPVERTFIVPLYREIAINNKDTSSISAFSAYDSEAGPTAELNDSFGDNFSFDNYRVMMRAKRMMKEAGVDETAIVFRSAIWGKAGEYTNISYEYPSSSSKGISHTVSVADKVDIKIFLKSGTDIVTTADGTTEWDVTITPQLGYDEVTYTSNGGTPPALLLSGGEYVKVVDSGMFDSDNLGVFKIVSSTSNSFTIHRGTGEAHAETGISNLVPNTVSFYNEADTTAEEIVDYVSSEMANFIIAELLDDNGTSGAGVISHSTLDNSVFASSNLSLMDGENWILSTDLMNTPQLTLKQNLSYDEDGPYDMRNGDLIRLIPNTPKQVSELINTLAVSGISTLATINTSNKDKRLQIATNTLGSDGSIQFVGGSANEISIPVLNTSSSIIPHGLGKTNIPSSYTGFVYAGQLLKIEAETRQEKKTDIYSTTTLTITPNSPAPGQTLITLQDSDPLKRLFNEPRTGLNIGDNEWKIEKQGMFNCLVWTGVGSAPNLSTVEEGDSINISSPFNPLNRGLFRVVAKYGDSVYYETKSFTPEQVTLASQPDAIVFSDYDTTTVGDFFEIRGAALDSYAGRYPIAEIIDKNNVVINSIIPALPLLVLAGEFPNVLVLEKTPYSSYKKVKNVVIEPTNEEIANIVWENDKNIIKISELSRSVITSPTKISFPTKNKIGFDSYRYDIGLMAEANRVVYGDPKDTSTYPGVAASGVDIFIDPPLVRRISVGVVIRLNTGVPLIQITDQVRNVVSSLINANPVGQSIAISNIISSVDAIPGVKAMAITSPQFDQNHDMILIQPNEKSLVTNPSLDISVSQIG